MKHRIPLLLLALLPIFLAHSILAVPIVLEASYELEHVTTDQNTADVKLFLDSNEAIEGFVAVVQFAPSIVSDVEAFLGVDAAAADYMGTEEGANFLAVGVVVDLIDPMGGVVPAGADLHLLTFRFTRNDFGMSPVELVDGTFGEPAKDNLIVVGGVSFDAASGLVLTDGSVTFTPEPSTLLLLAGGLAGMALTRRERSLH